MAHYSPVGILSSLGLSSEVELEEFASRNRSFASVHMGTRDLPIGALFQLLEANKCLIPPRTGHIGNWEDISRGRAGAMDFNQTICTRGLGYPLIYCFTQTETDQAQTGDRVYLPGSIVSNGKRQILSLYTWDGHSFVRRNGERSLLCPLVQIDCEGALVPLIEVHWKRMQAIPNFQFALEAEIILKHEAEVCSMLTFLLEWASNSINPRSLYQDLISHAAFKDGTVARCRIQRTDNQYQLDDVVYPDVHTLVQHTMILLRAVTEPRAFVSAIETLPDVFPVLSNVFTRIATAHFLTHYPYVVNSPRFAHEPVNVHLHWGARDMAGFPPRQRGYFMSRSKTRSFRWISDALSTRFPRFLPIYFALLPASVFMLCPTTAHPDDAELLAGLFSEIRRIPNNNGNPSVVQLTRRVEEITEAWRCRYGHKLSPYFANRFLPGRSVLHPCEIPEQSRPVEPEGFRELTFQQACMIVGALMETPASHPAQRYR